MFKKKVVVQVACKFKGTQGEEMYYVVEAEKAATVLTEWFGKQVKVTRTDGFGQPGDFMIFVNNTLVHTKLGLSHGFLSTCAQEQKDAVKKAVQDVIDGNKPEGVERQVIEAQMKADDERQEAAEKEIAQAKKEKEEKEQAEQKRQEALREAAKKRQEDEAKAKADAEAKKKKAAELARKKAMEAKKKEEMEKQKAAEEQDKKRQEEEAEAKVKAEEEARIAEEARKKQEEEDELARQEAARKKREEENFANLMEMDKLAAINKAKLLEMKAKRIEEQEKNAGLFACCRPDGGSDVDGVEAPLYVS